MEVVASRTEIAFAIDLPDRERRGGNRQNRRRRTTLRGCSVALGERIEGRTRRDSDARRQSILVFRGGDDRRDEKEDSFSRRAYRADKNSGAQPRSRPETWTAFKLGNTSDEECSLHGGSSADDRAMSDVSRKGRRQRAAKKSIPFSRAR